MKAPMTKTELLKVTYSNLHRAADLVSKAWARQQTKGAEVEEMYQACRAALCALEEMRNEAMGTRGKVGV